MEKDTKIILISIIILASMGVPFLMLVFKKDFYFSLIPFAGVFLVMLSSALKYSKNIKEKFLGELIVGTIGIILAIVITISYIYNAYNIVDVFTK